MTPDPSYALLRGLRLFEAADEGALRRLVAACGRARVAGGAALCEQGDDADSMFIVVSGKLIATCTDGAGNRSVLRVLEAGDPIGEVPALVGGPRTATVTADADSELLVVPRAALDDLVVSAPEVLSQLTEVVRARQRRSALVGILAGWLGEIEDGLLEDLEGRASFVFLRRGEVAVRQGEGGDAWFLVLSGRLRVEIEDAAGRHKVGEVGRGGTFGEVAVLSGSKRGATLIAERGCELVRVGKADFDAMIDRWPIMLRLVTRRLAHQLADRGARRVPGRRAYVLLPGPGVDLVAFAGRLADALTPHGKVRIIGPEVLGQLGLSRERLAEDHPAWARLDRYLEDLDDSCAFALLLADAAPTPWSRIAVDHADQIVLVAHADGDPAPRAVEQALVLDDQPCRLVLLQPESTARPATTAAWLARRGTREHHHIREGHVQDLARLARALAGRSVGLTLGGGGARGFAHIGVLRALHEHGVPIDVVGGTSMGAFVAALHASGQDWLGAVNAAREMLRRGAHRDFTVPMIALLRSRRAEAALGHVFEGLNIEDFWTPYFAVSCDITTARMVVHERGPAAHAIRASTAVPGVLYPVRWGQSLLVDGGLVDNLPVGVMRRRCEGVVIAVDVASQSELTAPAAPFPSPWSMLWQRLSPWRKRESTPTIVDVLLGSMLVASSERSAAAQLEADLCLHPPVSSYGMMSFDQLDAIVEAGYAYTMRRIEDAAGFCDVVKSG